MIALQFERSVPRFLAARALSSRAPGLVANGLAPLRLTERIDPPLPAGGWVRVSPALAGICGSDLAMLTGHASFYFSPIVSAPFVPGHEIVGRLSEDAGGLTRGTRVVVEPVLHCETRGISPVCTACALGDTGCCERTAHGHIAPGLQTGYCQDTGGGWATTMVAHSSQVHPLPDEVPDEAAVLIEPLACAVHAALRARIGADDVVLVAGAGTIGLLTIAAVRHLTPAGRIVAVAKHPRQRAEARRLGADDIASPSDAVRAVRFATRAIAHHPERGGAWLAGGCSVALECSGRMDSLETCLRATRARGRVVLVGLPTAARVDMAPLWHKELDLTGAYAYGTEDAQGGRRRTFEIAVDLARNVDLTPLLSAVYPLSRWREAIDHALDAGRLDAVKIAFAPNLR